MEVVSMINDRHLGDTIAIMTLLHSRAIETGEKFSLFGPSHIEDLLHLFEFCGLQYDGPQSKNHRIQQSIIKLMPTYDSGPLKNNSATVTFLRLSLFKTDNQWKYIYPKKITLPKKRFSVPKENILCFQFDMRSPHRGKPKITNFEARSFLRKHKAGFSQVFGIGGVDTNKYLPEYDFFLGNIKELSYFMASCSLFVGIDSGMSHLAGICGCEGEILMSHEIKSDFTDLMEFYKKMYPSLRTHLRGNSQIPFI